MTNTVQSTNTTAGPVAVTTQRTSENPSPTASTSTQLFTPAPEKEPHLPEPPSGDYDIALSDRELAVLVDRRFAQLFATWQLPAETIASLRTLLLERQRAAVDAANAAMLIGLNNQADAETIRHAIDEAEAPYDQAVQRAVGDSAFAVYRRYLRTAEERNAAGDLARLLASTPEPLRPEQEKQVVDLLMRSQPAPLAKDVSQALFGGVIARAPITDETLAAATRILSPRQLETFRTLQQQQGTPR